MKQDLPLRRLFAEGTAIVGSILLAFAIDAWWQQRTELKQAETAETIAVRATTRLEGALGSRVFYSTYIVNGLAEIYAIQAKIIAMLETHIEAKDSQ